MATVTEEMNFYFTIILTNLQINSNSHICLVATLLDNPSLDNQLFLHSLKRFLTLSEMMKGC